MKNDLNHKSGFVMTRDESSSLDQKNHKSKFY